MMSSTPAPARTTSWRLGAAAMYAASLALLANEFQGSQRGLAFGVWGAVTGAALAVAAMMLHALVPLVAAVLVFRRRDL